MDMGMGMDTGGAPLNDSGVDFSNATQAMDFLDELLDDTVFQVDGNRYARYFWYAIVVVIGIASICNILQAAILRARYASTPYQLDSCPSNKGYF